MEDIAVEVGYRIRNIRRGRGMTIHQLAEGIHKSKSTVSKYENGEISMDITTIYDISRVLCVDFRHLLPHESMPSHPEAGCSLPPVLFRDTDKLFAYFYDGRNGKLVRCVLDILPSESEKGYQVVLYMNVQSLEHYQICENTYYGEMKHFDVLTNIFVKNRDTPVEQITISILASFMDVDRKYGLMFGVSSRPIMPIALKMLFSKTPIFEDKNLISLLKISKEDIRIMKVYNMFSVM